MKELKFVKMTGAGNDFIIIDRELNFVDITKEDIKLLCDRKYGIGADGLIIIHNSDDAKCAFSVDFYNSDGSSGMLCGNGARCSLRYANLIGRIGKHEVNFKFSDRIYRGIVPNSNDIVKFYIDDEIYFEEVRNFEFENYNLNGAYFDVGTQHLVLDFDNFSDKYSTIDDIPVFVYGRSLRYHQKFQPKGVNVNFIQQSSDAFKIRTYERGVEDETLACGTGSISSALYLGLFKNFQPPIKMITRSKEELVVDFQIINDKLLKNISLTGPAKYVFTGKIKIW